MDRARWIELNLRGMQATFASFAASGGAELIERDGLLAMVCAAVPERSFFNSVVYSEAAALASAYEEVAAAYADAGCAWTVWVPEDDTAGAQLLEAHGHLLDAQPLAMGLELGDSPEPDLSGLDWTDRGAVEEMAALNDAAYGFAPGTSVRGFGRRIDGLRVYITRLEGRPVATVCARDHAADCGIWMVATAESARGQGLSTALMRQALADASRRGCRTSTLQATKLGAPIYRRLGYGDWGALGMWERRPPHLAGDAMPRPPA